MAALAFSDTGTELAAAGLLETAGLFKTVFRTALPFAAGLALGRLGRLFASGFLFIRVAKSMAGSNLRPSYPAPKKLAMQSKEVNDHKLMSSDSDPMP